MSTTKRDSAQTEPAVTIRRATASDVKVLARHRAAMFSDMGQLSPVQREPMTRATAAYLRKAIVREEYLAWIAEAAGIAVGGAGVQLRPILPRPRPETDDIEFGPEAIVLNVYVEPAFRRRGVADALVRTVLDALAARDIRRIVLHASQDGRRLYERLGFSPTNEMRLTRAASREGDTMATSGKQRAAARRNIKKAAGAAKRKRTIAHLSKQTRTALGKQGAKIAARKRR
jgi:ribosomal protein S18 acetylase RimI-like enzyme